MRIGQKSCMCDSMISKNLKPFSWGRVSFILNIDHLAGLYLICLISTQYRKCGYVAHSYRVLTIYNTNNWVYQLVLKYQSKSAIFCELE